MLCKHFRRVRNFRVRFAVEVAENSSLFIIRRSGIAEDGVGREQIEGSATCEVEDKPLF